MRPEQWEEFKRAARREAGAEVPVALIVDSPWIPGHVGVSHMEYFVDPAVWLESNLRVIREFPEIILFPSWWVEYGMAIEPSAFGNRIHFHVDKTPDQSPTMPRAEDVDLLSPVNPQTDGLMPFALERYRKQKDAIFRAGYTIPVVAARGPLCVASFLRGVTPLMMDIADGREETHKLLALTTRCVIDWLAAQAEAMGDSVEGILVLDDIAGFLSGRAYKEWAHPYLKQICDAFPARWIKVYHNDANVRPFLAELPDTGFDVLNWSDKIGVAEAQAKTQGRMTLMGNVAPLELGVRGTAEMVEEAARKVKADSGGRGLILSVGGGVSPGMPAENIRALARA
ncbi:MAG: uroporphyrinogen decarboxylase family protein [Candidatus Solibacter usitatus]|nr:uroporphyrinogen decarboxylase family protein [Candidatus Solibacter usitatus]